MLTAAQTQALKVFAQVVNGMGVGFTSFVILSMTVFTFVHHKKAKRTERPLLNWHGRFVLHILIGDFFEGISASIVDCKAAAFILTLGIGIEYSWKLCFSIMIFKTVRSPLQKFGFGWEIGFTAFAYLVPLALALVGWFMNIYGLSGSWCYILGSETYYRLGLSNGPLLASIVLCSVILSITWFRVWRIMSTGEKIGKEFSESGSADDASQEQVRRKVKILQRFAYIILYFIFVRVWSPLERFYEMDHPEDPLNLGLQVLLVIAKGSGIADSILYGMDDNFWNGFKMLKSKIMDSSSSEGSATSKNASDAVIPLQNVQVQCEPASAE